MSTEVKMPVGVIGLGAMGLGVALSLVREGFEVHACDVRPEAVQKVVDTGGIRAESPAAMAKSGRRADYRRRYLRSNRNSAVR